MSPTFATNKTRGGYLCGDVASAMQKSIRRGLERESLFWATELDMAGYGEYVWRRLRLIASEDVGMAEPYVALAVRALYENWTQQRAHSKKSAYDERGVLGGEQLFLLQAVFLLVRSPKSRMLDHALMVMYEGERDPIEMPDWALDKHTAAGKRMGRGHAHFFEVGAVLANEAEVGDVYAAEGRAARSGSPYAPDVDE